MTPITNEMVMEKLAMFGQIAANVGKAQRAGATKVDLPAIPEVAAPEGDGPADLSEIKSRSTSPVRSPTRTNFGGDHLTKARLGIFGR